MSSIPLRATQRDAVLGSFDYYRPEDPAHMFIDGVAASSMGATMTLVEAYRTMGVDLDAGTLVEKRVHALTISIPTRVLLEFCEVFLKQARSNRETLNRAAAEEARKISNLLESDSK